MEKDNINKNLETFIYLEYAREIKEWMEKNEIKELPQAKSMNDEERRLSSLLKKIKRYLITPYLKLETHNEKEKYEKEHPEVLEIMEILYSKELEEPKIPVYLKNARDIEVWIERSGDTRLPSQQSEEHEERRLGRALNTLKQNLIKPYLKLESQEEKCEYEKEHPEIKEVIEILDNIGAKNFRFVSSKLEYARTIKKWMEQKGTSKPPSTISKDIEERKLGCALNYIRHYWIKPYLQLGDENKKEIYEKNHPGLKEIIEIVSCIDEKKKCIVEKKPSRYLKNAREIKEWIEKSGDTKPPHRNSEDEKEKILAIRLSTIKQQFVKPYLQLASEEQKREYEKKHPEIQEVIEILKWINENNIPIYLKYAREIKVWIERSGDTKLPNRKSKDKKEKFLGIRLETIKQNLIKPYLEIDNEEQKQEYERKHPELQEVMEIVRWIDENNVSRYLKNARKIKDWMQKNGDQKSPSQIGKSKDERKLGKALSTIKQNLIKPYLKIDDEEKKQEYEIKHPELQEVMEIVYEIDKNGTQKKQREFAESIQKELKIFVGKHVDSNQEIRSELNKRVKEFEVKTTSLCVEDD